MLVSSRRGAQISLAKPQEAAFIAGALCQKPVSGLTHGFYKYPARFSPTFARPTIEAFSEPGDLVLDPYAGGGTTLVEAMAAGRNAIGVDVNTLSSFVATVKTTLYSEAELAILAAWGRRTVKAIDAHLPTKQIPGEWDERYLRHMNHDSRRLLTKAVTQAVCHALRLESAKLVAFARCAVLLTAQQCYDKRKTHPSFDKFRQLLDDNVTAMIAGARSLAAKAPKNSNVRIFNCSSAGLQPGSAPKLVLTSPPYPGVHMLYNRWQVDGGKETAFPYAIAGVPEEASNADYTMGDRHEVSLDTYFDNLRKVMKPICAVADARTTVVQMVGFSQASQLDRYLDAMNEVGFRERFLNGADRRDDGRIWRDVPGRTWYAEMKGRIQASREVVLIHTKMH